jgi:2-amino-4-hydroxy-6-hydroxymethyldihydropteridine diphosphokinase
MSRVYLLLGSNVDKERNLSAAVALLRPHGLLAMSPAYETPPVGTDHPDPFLNAAALLETDLAPEVFKQTVCAAVERKLGRVRDPRDKFAPRTIDLDVALWDERVFTILGAPVPDPDIARYLHAARPLADLSPALILPGDGRSLRQVVRDLETDADPGSFPRLRPDVMLSA